MSWGFPCEQVHRGTKVSQAEGEPRRESQGGKSTSSAAHRKYQRASAGSSSENPRPGAKKDLFRRENNDHKGNVGIWMEKLLCLGGRIRLFFLERKLVRADPIGGGRGTLRKKQPTGSGVKRKKWSHKSLSGVRGLRWEEGGLKS